MKISILGFLFLFTGLAVRKLFPAIKGGYAASKPHSYITFDFK
ncbi:MAG TPA: hypothetical protein VGE25_09355 [Sediminibacterium sp.]